MQVDSGNYLGMVSMRDVVSHAPTEYISDSWRKYFLLDVSFKSLNNTAVCASIESHPKSFGLMLTEI